MHSWTAKEIERGQINTRAIYTQLLGYISAKINSYLKLEKSTAFYDLLLGYKLEQISHIVYICDKELGSSRLSGMDLPIDLRPMACLADISRACQTKRFHADIKNLVLALRRADFNDFLPLKLDTETVLVKLGRPNQSIKDRLGLPSKKKILISNVKMNCSFLERTALRVEWRNWACFNDLLFPFQYTSAVDWDWRIAELKRVGDWEPSLFKLACWIALAYLPVEVLEAFKAIDIFCSELDLDRPDIVFSNSGLHSKSLFNHIVAKWCERGTKLWYAQHGGSYGIEKNLPVQAYEIRVSEKFFSWGWKEKSNKVLPMPPVYSYKAKNRVAQGKDLSIYLNCCDYPEVQFRLSCQPSNGLLQEFYRATNEFLDCINEEIDICIRPYPHEYDYPFTELLKSKFPAATFDHSRLRPTVRYHKHDLIVHNYFNTSALESLAMNIPTICFYSSATLNFDDSFLASELILRKLGILHSTASSAAEFICNEDFNLNKWWMSDELQSQRIRFCRSYANLTPKWKSIMSSQLIELSAPTR